MRLAAEWLTHPGTIAVFDALADHQAWFVGGCVRNGLLRQAVDDIDIATDATPEMVMKRAEEAGLRAVPTGIDHGTVTLIAQDKPHEITTLRRDIETDGRHATVAFSTKLADDAARRDFTINALYATRDGDVIDPNGQGLADLRARAVRFIGDPGARITEDYLRILRFFRFHAWYADPDGGMDADGLAACAAHLDGLDRLAKERITAEVMKLLAAPDPAPSVASMEHSGVLAAILPGANARLLGWLMGNEGNAPPDPIRRLAALCDAPDLRLSKADAARHALYRAEMGGVTPPDALGYRHGAAQAGDIVTLRCVLVEGRAPTQEDFADVAKGAEAVFPVQAADLMPDLQGPALGARLKTLEQVWIDSGFTLSRDALLDR